VSQVSRPMQIALLAAVAFAGVWFVALRPKPVPPPGTPAAAPAKPAVAPGAAGLGRAVDKAKGAAAVATDRGLANSDNPAPAAGSSASPQAATPAPSTSGSSSTSPAGAAASAKQAPVTGPGGITYRYDALPSSTAGVATLGALQAARLIGVIPPGAARNGSLPYPVRQGLARHKVIVLLFWRRGSADDAAVRKAVAGVNRHNGKVVVTIAPVTRVGAYTPVTRGVRVEETPTVIVVDGKRKAKMIVGYVDRATIDQAIVDALQA